jgi:hypothetical protein
MDVPPRFARIDATPHHTRHAALCKRKRLRLRRLRCVQARSGPEESSGVPCSPRPVPCLHRFGASMPTGARRGSHPGRVFPDARQRTESGAARRLAPKRCQPGTPRCGRGCSQPGRPGRLPCRRTRFGGLWPEGAASCRCATRPPGGRATPVCLWFWRMDGPWPVGLNPSFRGTGPAPFSRRFPFAFSRP